MKDSVFRKKSLDRISSPEQLNDYIKVSNPSVWVVLIALIIMIGAFVVWSFSGNITSKVNGTGVFESIEGSNSPSSVVCYINANYMNKLERGMQVRLYNNDANESTYVLGKVEFVSPNPVTQSDIIDKYDNQYIADSILSDDSQYAVAVLISLNKDSTSDDGYKWANGEKGNSEYIKTNNLCRVEIITEEITPIDFLINQSKASN